MARAFEGTLPPPGDCLWPCLLPDGWTLPIFITSLSDPGVPGVRSMCPDVCLSVTQTPFADLTDVALADEDSNSIPTDDVNRAILGNVAMQVASPSGQLKLMQVATLGGQTCNQFKKPQLLVKSTTNACCAIWWPILNGQIYKHCHRHNGPRVLSL